MVLGHDFGFHFLLDFYDFLCLFQFLGEMLILCIYAIKSIFITNKRFFTKITTTS